MAELLDNLANVQREIKRCAEKAGRNVDDIKLIVVSKTRSLDEVKQVAGHGVDVFAENTIQDAMTKIPLLSHLMNLEWHFIGHLQSKKAGKIPGYFQWVHSVDSLKLAKKLSTAMSNYSSNATLNCLIQVNVSAEVSKSGMSVAEVKPFLQQVLDLNLPCLQWRGLMTIGVNSDVEKTRQSFSQLRRLLISCQQEYALENFDQLSMGMSDDYCMAIEEGATMIRIGTSIFGQRN